MRQLPSMDAAERSAEAGVQEMTQALRKMQDHLSELAQEWSAHAPGVPAQAAVAASPISAPTTSTAMAMPLAQVPVVVPAMEVATRNAPAALVAAVADGGRH